MEIVAAKCLLTMNEEDEPIEGGAIAVDMGRILDVGTLDDLKAKYKNAPIIDHPSHVLMPGLVNTHSNLELSNYFESHRAYLKEEPVNGDYTDWLISTMKYRREASSSFMMTAVQKGIQAAIDSGTTCIGESTTFEGTYGIVDEMGIRGIIYNQIYSGKMDVAQDLFENALALVEKYFNPSKDAKISAGFYPTAPYLLSKNLLKILSQHAETDEIPIKIHASESFPEMEFFFDSKGLIGEKLFPSIGWTGELPPVHLKTPIKYLDEIGFLKASPSIIGGIHLSEACYKLLQKSMCSIIYCPTNNTFFGHGVIPLGKIKDHGITVGLGTGAPVRNRAFSMWDEMREAMRLSTETTTPKELLRMATIGGAQVMGLQNQAGTLAAGKFADYIVADLPPGYEIDKSYIYGALIRNTNNFNIRKTVVDGEVLKNI